MKGRKGRIRAPGGPDRSPDVPERFYARLRATERAISLGSRLYRGPTGELLACWRCRRRIDRRRRWPRGASVPCIEAPGRHAGHISCCTGAAAPTTSSSLVMSVIVTGAFYRSATDSRCCGRWQGGGHDDPRAPPLVSGHWRRDLAEDFCWIDRVSLPGGVALAALGNRACCAAKQEEVALRNAHMRSSSSRCARAQGSMGGDVDRQGQIRGCGGTMLTPAV